MTQIRGTGTSGVDGDFAGISIDLLKEKMETLPWNLAANCVLAITYFLTARLGLAYAIPPGNATAVWPPSGIALGALFIFGVRVCPGIFVGSLVANLGTGLSLMMAVTFGAGNTLEALIAFALCHRFLDIETPFKMASCGFRLFLIAAVACAVAATVGASSLAYSGAINQSQFPDNWLTWWLGDISGVMLITPIFLLLQRRSVWHARSSTYTGTFVSLFVLGVVSNVVFGNWIPEGHAESLLYMPLIVVFWLLLTFDPIVVCLANLLIAVIAVLSTSAGIGPFATEVVTQSLFELQLFMTVYTLTGLTLTGVLTRQRIIERRESQLAARIHAEEQLRLKEAELAHVSRLSTMGELIAGIAHEINQPLYAISNLAATSKQMLGTIENKQHDKLCEINQQITEQAVRAGEIIRRLRGFVSKTDGHRSAFDINDAVTDALRLLDTEARKSKVSIEKTHCHAPEILVFADRVQTEQVLVNLLRNGFDSLSDNDPANRVIVVQTSCTEDEVRVSVSDNGVGIPEASAHELFEPFFTTKESGMGMGLAISRTIIQAHGGRIWAAANSKGGTGTTFTVVLPRFMEE